MSNEVDLVALRRPRYVTIPLTGRRVAVRFFRAEQKQMYNNLVTQPQLDNVLLVALLRYAIPDLTDDEMNDLSLDEDIPNILVEANAKAKTLELMLKNGLSDGESPAPSPTPASAPTTKSRTSSPKSAKHTKAGRTNSSTSSGTGSSLPSTG